MTIDQALGILEITAENRNMDAVKTAWKAKILQYHPDRNPDGLEMTKLINAAFDRLEESVDYWQQTTYEQQDADYHIDVEIDHIYKEIRHYPDIEITLAGCWLWVSGDTWPIKEHLKTLGFSWAGKKKAWSWKPANSKRRRKKGKEWSFDDIYSKYGRVDMDTERRAAFTY